MTVLEAIFLGLIQGLTEFIPVSSSGHLVLLREALGVSEGGLGFDIALHLGTLAALIVFFHRDISELFKQMVQGGPKRRLGLILALATVPAAFAGAWLQESAETTFRSPYLVCLTLALMALVMLAAEARARRRTTSVDRIGFRQGLIIGAAQVAALVPGVSRSGSTITSGLFAGLDRVAATRFSFLLAIPITTGAILKVFLDGELTQHISREPAVFTAGVISAFVSGALAIRFLLKFVAKHDLRIFAYYRLALAAVGLIILTAV